MSQENKKNPNPSKIFILLVCGTKKYCDDQIAQRGGELGIVPGTKTIVCFNPPSESFVRSLTKKNFMSAWRAKRQLGPCYWAAIVDSVETLYPSSSRLCSA